MSEVPIIYHSSRAVQVKLYKSLATLNELTALGKIYEASREAITILRQSAALDCYEVAEKACIQLMQYYKIYDPSDHFYQKYKIKKESFAEKKEQENKIYEYYNLIAGNFDRSRTISDTIKLDLEAYMLTIEGFRKNTKHGDFFLHKYYAFKCLYFQVHMDYSALISVGKEALLHFENSFLDFRISKLLFANQIAYGYLAQRNEEMCEKYLNICEKYKIVDSSAYCGYRIINARYQLSKGENKDFGLSDIITRYPDMKKMVDMIEVYRHLSEGRPVHQWDHLKRYKNDPTGLGIALNVARLWSAKLSGDILDHQERMRKYVKRYLSDDIRSRTIIKHLLFDAPLDGLKEAPFNVNIEIIPYEQIGVYLSQKIELV